MTAGRGWIAVALVIFALPGTLSKQWPEPTFRRSRRLVYRMQALITIPSFFLKMLPYLFTIGVLILATSRTRKKHLGHREL